MVNIKNQTDLIGAGGNIMLEQMKALIRERSMCVLATIAGAKPYCSLMAYVADESCEEIYMVTHRKTQKYQNLSENPAVSLLIDTREEAPRTLTRALTIEGTFHRIKDGTKKIKVKETLLKIHPHLKNFCDHPDAECLTDAHYVRL
jgi:nitroimidazol reductase NimA-like FMN-containing flavoprotein (pyridoxamine 5'-phosphate oxidase superfamily)